MRKVPRFLSRLFSPNNLQDIDIYDLQAAFANDTVRRIWLYEVYQELRNLNLKVEKSLLGGYSQLNDLSARRRAFQDVLEMILTAKRRHVEEKHPDPRIRSEVDLDRVTV